MYSPASIHRMPRGCADTPLARKFSFVALGLAAVTSCSQEPVSPGLLSVTPSNLAFSAAVATTAPQGLTIHTQNLGRGGLHWVARVNGASPWLSVQPDSGVVGDSLLVQANPTGLGVGIYHDTVSIASAAGQVVSVPIEFEIRSLALTASRLAFSQQPTGVAAGTPTMVVVVARDSLGGTVTSFTGNVTVTVIPDSGVAVTVTAVAGVATASNLAIDRAGCHRLVASSPGLQPDTSATFCITPGPAAALAFSIQPTIPIVSCSPAGEVIGPIEVTILDAFANVVVSATNPVQIALGDNLWGATLSGTTTTNAASGVATFSNLSVTKSGSSFTLVATAAGLTAATSTPFGVPVDACYDHLVFTVQPSNTATGAPITPPVQVCAENGFGNIDTSFVGTVTIAIGGNPGGGTLSGTLTTPAVSGCATFADLRIDKAGSGYTLMLTTAGLGASTSATFNIGP